MGRTVIGIDPGAAGGICVYHDDGTMDIHVMPDSFPDIYDLLSEVRTGCGSGNIKAFLEDVGHGMPGQSSSATAKFARHNGHLEMALYALGIPTVKVTPQKWQKFYSNTLGKSSSYEKREWKNRLKTLAQQMFPSEKITLKTADAVLIADYGMKQTYKINS